MIIIFYSCQSEIDINEGENQNTNNSTSQTTKYYSRIGMYNGSLDDMIDNNSCSSIKLPISLLANNIRISINNTSDYQLIINIFNQSPLDEDRIVLNFPVTVINQNYTESQISNQQQLDSLHNICNETIVNNTSSITCVNILYPIKISLFNTAIEQSKIVTISTDLELYNFMTNLSVNEVYNIQYPITLNTVGKSNIIKNDEELETVINNCVESSVSQNPSIILNYILNENLWKINYFINNNINLTSTFENYNFDYNENFTLNVKHKTIQSYNVNGVWKSMFINNITTLTLNFNNEINFKILNKEWEVTAITPNQINLKFQDKDYLILTTL